jgi:gamma-glutamyltranspeptidase / glutathione hydrolase
MQELTAMGHRVVPIGSGSVGGFQSIVMMPPAPAAPGAAAPAHGFYRAGSDHRKDGEAVGW